LRPDRHLLGDDRAVFGVDRFAGVLPNVCAGVIDEIALLAKWSIIAMREGFGDFRFVWYVTRGGSPRHVGGIIERLIIAHGWFSYCSAHRPRAP